MSKDLRREKAIGIWRDMYEVVANLEDDHIDPVENIEHLENAMQALTELFDITDEEVAE